MAHVNLKGLSWPHGAIDTAATHKVVSVLDDAYELLQYSTELLVADVLDKGTFIKIKYLIDTMEKENHEMVRKILHAKAEK